VCFAQCFLADVREMVLAIWDRVHSPFQHGMFSGDRNDGPIPCVPKCSGCQVHVLLSYVRLFSVMTE
jgi:hypothetical protein